MNMQNYIYVIFPLNLSKDKISHWIQISINQSIVKYKNMDKSISDLKVAKPHSKIYKSQSQKTKSKRTKKQKIIRF